jgi:hypothetical protein
LRESRSAYFYLAAALQLVCTTFAHAGTIGEIVHQPNPVPRVGCPSDGQRGPQLASKGGIEWVWADKLVADLLAYYGEHRFGVLAPKGWHCVALLGSNGAMILVTPRVIRGPDFFSHDWRGISGDGITFMIRSGETSGRFDVARISARIFPSARSFVDSVIHEGLEPASHFTFAPFPRDKLVHNDVWSVEYETPPHAKGLGTQAWLLPNGAPIRSAAVLQDSPPNLYLVNIRLPNKDQYLIGTIVEEFRMDRMPRL